MRLLWFALLPLFLVLLYVPVPAAAQTTSLLRVSGTVYEEGAPSQTPMQVEVANLDRTQIVPAKTNLGTAGVGKYSVVFFDPFGAQIMGAVGDRLQVTLISTDSGQVIEHMEHIIAADEISDGFGDVLVDIRLSAATALTFKSIEPQQVKPDHLLAFSLSLLEPIPDTTFGIVNPPAGAQLDATTGVFAWVPDETQIGDYELEFTASADTRTGLTTVHVKVIPLIPTTTILLIDGIAYDAPGVPTTRDVTIHVRNLDREDVSGSVKVGAAGPGRFSLLLFEPISGRTMGASGEILEIRAVLADGTELLVLFHELTDEDIVNNEGVVTFELSLNRPPTLAPIAPQTVRVRQNFQLALEGGDPDGDPLQFSAQNMPAEASIDSHRGIFRWVPSLEGEYQIQFSVTDGKQAYDDQIVLFTVIPNSAPVFDPIGELPIAEAGVLLSIQLSATDPDDDAVSYLVSGAPVGIEFDQTTGLLLWTPSEAEIGDEYDLTFAAIDTYNALSTISVHLMVVGPPFYEVGMSVVEPSIVTIDEHLGSAGFLIRITNAGNREDTFHLSVTAEEPLTALLDPPDVVLGPGDTHDVGLLIQTEPQTPAGEYTTSVHAVSENDPNQQAEVFVKTVTLTHTVLSVAPTAVDFDIVNVEKALAIRNLGTGTLNWEIQTLPTWIHTDALEGEILDETQVILRVLPAELEPGEYSATFAISDLHEVTIPVSAHLVVPEPHAATLKLEPSSQEANVGESITLNLRVEADVFIQYLELGFAFDPSILQFTELSTGSEQLQWEHGRINNEVGQTTRAYEVFNRDDSVINDLDLQLHFAVVGAGSTAISLVRLLLRATDQRTDFRITKIPAKVESAITIPAWDINEDGVTDVVDLVLVGQHFGETNATAGDVNGDGLVDILDLVAIGSHFGEQWEQISAPAASQWVQHDLVWQLHYDEGRVMGELRAIRPIPMAGWSLQVNHSSDISTDLQMEVGRAWESDPSPHYIVGDAVGFAGADLQNSGSRPESPRLDPQRTTHQLTTVRLVPGHVMVMGVVARVSWATPDFRDDTRIREDIGTALSVNLRVVDALGQSRDWRADSTTIRWLPSQTSLGANYPNPFNPETWIPFHLSQDGEVTIRIYDIQGHLVRTLDLGLMSAGIYEHRADAAYWDGRDQLGQLAASGIYYYQLVQNGFSATRRCVIRK